MTTATPLNYDAPVSRIPVPAPAYAATAGRVLMSVIFLLSGFGKLMHLSGMAAAVHLPPAVLALAAAVELGGGLSLLLGLWPRIGALGLFLFLIPTTLMFHNFWAAAPDHQQDQMVHFLKNLAVMGGLLMIVAFGPGPLSITPVRRVRV
jgi:putative oxidoreductase